jgi:hypothetical protein
MGLQLGSEVVPGRNHEVVAVETFAGGPLGHEMIPFEGGKEITPNVADGC